MARLTTAGFGARRSSAEARRFYLLVGSVCLALLLATLLVIWRGDQIGVDVADTLPRPGAGDVSSRERLRLSFGEAIDQASVQLSLNPPVPGKLDWLDPRTAVWMPQLGLTPDTQYNVTVAPGVRSLAGRETREAITWSFRTRPLRVVYLTDGQDGPPNLASVAIDPATAQREGSPRHLTSEASGSLEFSVAPDGSEIAYTVYHADGHADIKAVDTTIRATRPLYEDKAGRAGLLAWSPAGDVLAWERSALMQAANNQTGLPAVGQPRVWLLTADGRPVGPAGRQDGVFFRPMWSPDGTKLAYFDGAAAAVVVFNFTDAPLVIPTDTDGVLSWSPDGQALLTARVAGDPPRQRIQQVNLKTQQATQLSPDDPRLHDSYAEWSPDGQRIAFIRSVDGFANSRLWLMNVDGGEPRQITDDPRYRDSSAVWSPNGRYVLFSRYAAQGVKGPELWVYDTTNSRAWSLGVDGLGAAWLP